jgi:hypothetical protein
MYIIIKRSYPTLRVRVINCEIRIVIYTFFRVLGNEKYRKKLLSELAGKVSWKHRLLGGVPAYGREEGKNLYLQSIPCINKKCRLDILRSNQLHLVFRVALHHGQDDSTFYLAINEDRVTLGAAKRRVLRCNFDNQYSITQYT